MVIFQARQTYFFPEIVFFLVFLSVFCLATPPVILGKSILKTEGLSDIEIRISNNDRTKSSLITDKIYDCLKDENIQSWEQLLPGILEQCLLNSKLFAEVQVTINKPVIEVEVQERWTLLPIPYIFSSDDDYTFGLFLMENNLFGLGKKGGVGGSYSANGTSYFLYYFDPSILFSDWFASMRIGNNINEPSFEYDNIEHYSYEIDDFSYGLGIGRKVFLPKLWVSIGIEGNDKKFDQVDLYSPPEDYDSFGIETRILYKNTDFKFYFNEGVKIELEIEMQAYRSDDNPRTESWDLTIDWQKQFISNNALQLQVQLQEVHDSTLGDVLLLGRTKGFRGVESKGLWAYSAQSLSIDYQIPVLRYDYGTWTISPFLDLTHFDAAVDIPVDSFFAGGISGSLYLKNIAFPGVGLVMGYNDEFDGFFVSFSLGLQF